MWTSNNIFHTDNKFKFINLNFYPNKPAAVAFATISWELWQILMKQKFFIYTVYTDWIYSLATIEVLLPAWVSQRT